MPSATHHSSKFCVLHMACYGQTQFNRNYYRSRLVYLRRNALTTRTVTPSRDKAWSLTRQSVILRTPYV
jgi:hypothetical protein